MEKILKLYNALKTVGIDVELTTEDIQFSMDNKAHKAISIESRDGTLCLLFHPNTYKYVNSFLDCPIVKIK